MSDSAFAHTYTLRCLVCGATCIDDGLQLSCAGDHRPALLTTEYADRQFQPDPDQPGLYRYHRWLPIRRTLAGAGAGVVYRSERLAAAVGVPELWIAFNGFWPERGATHTTATFKELEAFAVLARLPAGMREALVIASAGNTAAAFAWACSLNAIRSVIIMPASGLARMQFPEPLAPCVSIVALDGASDYYDAIVLSDRLCALDGFVAEGGVRNVARRDGIGTTMLQAVEAIGRLPGAYFQAIGSGAGGIATHQAALRLVADRRFGANLPRQILSQNAPFAPIYQSWRAGSRELVPLDEAIARQQLQQIAAGVLSNRKPPYAIAGGVFDTLSASGGDMRVADNQAARAAMQLFAACEGVDIDPEAGVALATLVDAARAGELEGDAPVLLHVTGGGNQRRRAEVPLVVAQPQLRFDPRDVPAERILEQIVRLVQ